MHGGNAPCMVPMVWTFRLFWELVFGGKGGGAKVYWSVTLVWEFNKMEGMVFRILINPPNPSLVPFLQFPQKGGKEGDENKLNLP